MAKLLNWWDKYILKIGIAFLLLFIPLYPKLPLIDIVHTWVYIRLEDLLVAFFAAVFLLQIWRRQVSLKSPLTWPIVIYWLVGGLSVLHAIVFVGPSLAEFFPKLVLLHFFRRIEYMGLFFLALASVKTRRDAYHYFWIFTVMLVLVIVYGFGQRFLSFPAFLTMNEEFAKGVPLHLPPGARISATFAGHYDLAAFLVFAIALLLSVFFGVKKWLLKGIILLVTAGAGGLLLFTASRVSFVVSLITGFLILILQKKKILILPVVIVSFLVLTQITNISERFAKTLRIEPVVYDAKTGKALVTLAEFQLRPTPTPLFDSDSPFLPIMTVPQLPVPTPTPYEQLPLGSGFIDLPFVVKAFKKATTLSPPVKLTPDFLVKEVIVYDISFTTRVQGGWPRALEAFHRNLLFGSGYSTISLATDNDYLRLLGETGLLGFFSFLGIFAIFLLVARQAVRKIKDPFTRAFIIGVTGGLFGIMLNAFLIDVFEASKVAYVLWMMLGIAVGLFALEVKEPDSLLKEAVRVLKSPLTAFLVFLFGALFLFADSLNHFFVADDFTWLRWAAETKTADLFTAFTESKGFFYRPLSRLVYYYSYLVFGLKPPIYHLFSVLLHLGNSLLVYFLAAAFGGHWLVAVLTGLLFLILPIHGETVFWVSGFSGIFAAFFYFAALWFFTFSVRKHFRKGLFFGLSLIAFAVSLSFYEMAVTLPLTIFLFLYLVQASSWRKSLVWSLPFWVLDLIYFGLRNLVARSHFLSGDYAYNLKNLPFNILGNLYGYFGEMFFSTRFIAVYDWTRLFFREHKFSLVILAVAFTALIVLGRYWRLKLSRLSLFSGLFFVAALLPVLPLGNIAERYLYIASFGVIFWLAQLAVELYKSLHHSRFPRLRFVVVLAILLIFYVEIRELQAVKTDWRQASKISQQILETLPAQYPQLPTGSRLYFVNLPLRVNRAWVFPVGLDDGLWFTYKDESLKIYKGNRLDQALDFQKLYPTTKVFRYNGDKLEEVRSL